MEFGGERGEWFDNLKKKPSYMKHIVVLLEVIMRATRQLKRSGIADYGGLPL